MRCSLLIATGSRPEAFNLCLRWMAEQTQQPDEIIIVDDGPEPSITLADSRTKIIRPDPLWDPENPINTQARNLLLGLEQVTGDVVAIIEDDDCYMPTYLETVMEMFEEDEDGDLYLLGESWTTYYNARYRCTRKLRKPSYAALYQTAFRREEAVGLIKNVIEDHPENIDQELWKNAVASWGRTSVNLFDSPPHQTLGIKGLPGRLGVGVGNHMLSDIKHWTRDIDLKILEKLLKRVPERVEVYAKYWRKAEERAYVARRQTRAETFRKIDQQMEAYPPIPPVTKEERIQRILEATKAVDDDDDIPF